MQTECPHCHTVFHATSSDLEQANNQVRCGHCLAIFTADNPYDLIISNFQASEIEKKLDQADTPIYEKAVEEQLYENAEEKEKQPMHTVADVIPPELRAETRSSKSRFSLSGPLFLSFAIIVAIAAGIFQYSYYNRNELVKITQLRPWLEKLCGLADCTLPPPKDISLFLLSSKNIFTHPNTENALMVSATIVNQATFAQDFPIIELRFENVRGKTIAGRRFYAEEYLDIPKNQITQIHPDTPVSINLEIKDPGEDMVSYEFTFL